MKHWAFFYAPSARPERTYRMALLAAEMLEPKKSTKSFGDSKKGRIFAALKYDGGFI